MRICTFSFLLLVSGIPINSKISKNRVWISKKYYGIPKIVLEYNTYLSEGLVN
jgi:hypothetical protein